MNFADRLLEQNLEYTKVFDKGDVQSRPSLRVAVVTCMDSRIDTRRVLGISEGQAHVIRNAGGVVTDDVLRSLVISQRKLGTREIVLIHHTECGLLTFEDEQFKDEIEEHTGHRPGFDFYTFNDLSVSVSQSIEKVKACPYLIENELVRGFIYNVRSGELKEVQTTETKANCEPFGQH